MLAGVAVDGTGRMQALSIMNYLAEIVRAVMATLRQLVTRVVQTMRWISGRLVQVAEAVTERVLAAAVAAPRATLNIGTAVLKLGASMVTDVVTVPFRLAEMVLGGRHPPLPTAQSATADEASAQRAAHQQETDRQAAADRHAEMRDLVQAVRTVAAARSRGEPVDDVALDRLPDNVRDYLLALDHDECTALASASVMGLRGVLRQRLSEGVRLRKGVRNSAGPELISTAKAEARRREVRALVRGAMRAARGSQDDYEATIRSVACT